MFIWIFSLSVSLLTNLYFKIVICRCYQLIMWNQFWAIYYPTKTYRFLFHVSFARKKWGKMKMEKTIFEVSLIVYFPAIEVTFSFTPFYKLSFFLFFFFSFSRLYLTKCQDEEDDGVSFFPKYSDK